MKPTIILAALAFLVFVLVESLLPRTANAAPAPIVEQYLVVSITRGETDAQLAAQLNALAVDGWHLRCSLPNGVIMAR